MLLLTAQNVFGSRSNSNARFLVFTILRCCKNNKKAFTQANLQTWLPQLTSMLSKFKNKLRTNEAKNWKSLRIALPNSKFTGSYKKSVVDKILTGRGHDPTNYATSFELLQNCCNTAQCP